jgi:hypothetical protein
LIPFAAGVIATFGKPPGRIKFTTGVNDTGGNFATGINNTGGKKLKQYQAAYTLKQTFKKIYLYANSTTQRCTNKIFKTFLIEGFFHLPPVSLTPVVHLALQISPRVFKKIQIGSNGILGGLGEDDSCKKTEAKNLVTLSL